MNWLSCDNRTESIFASFAEKRIFSAEHLMKHDAETEDVGATVQFLTKCLLGRHVSNRSDNWTNVRRLISFVTDHPRLVASNEFCQSEVEDFCLTFGSNNDVLRFHITVNDPASMGRSQGAGHCIIQAHTCTSVNWIFLDKCPSAYPR